MKQVKGLEDIPGYNTQSDSNLLKELKIVVDILPTVGPPLQSTLVGLAANGNFFEQCRINVDLPTPNQSPFYHG